MNDFRWVNQLECSVFNATYEKNILYIAKFLIWLHYFIAYSVVVSKKFNKKILQKSYI